MGILLSILSLSGIILLLIVVNNQHKSIRHLKYHVNLLKGKNLIDHDSINQKFNDFSTQNSKVIENVEQNITRSNTELHSLIRNTKVEIEGNTKYYLNSWKNSNDFKNMLDLIIKAENSGNQKNNY